MGEPPDDERLASLLDGEENGAERDVLLSHLATDEGEDYEVFADTSEVIRALDDEDKGEQVSETTAPELVMPPVERLLALLDPDPTLLGRVLLAMKGGAAWARDEYGWMLYATPYKPSTRPHNALRLYDDGEHVLHALANPFTDSAAAWELETRELEGMNSAGRYEGVEVVWTHAAWVGEWRVRGGYRRVGPGHRDRHWAACLAVLHKYDDGGPLSSVLIRPTLEKLEAKP